MVSQAVRWGAAAGRLMARGQLGRETSGLTHNSAGDQPRSRGPITPSAAPAACEAVELFKQAYSEEEFGGNYNDSQFEHDAENSAPAQAAC